MLLYIIYGSLIKPAASCPKKF